MVEAAAAKVNEKKNEILRVRACDRKLRFGEIFERGGSVPVGKVRGSWEAGGNESAFDVGRGTGVELGVRAPDQSMPAHQS